MVAFMWGMAVRVLAFFVSLRRSEVRWVCACGYRKREQAVQTGPRACPYCEREITAERVR